MKKWTVFGIALCLVLFAFAGCGKKGATSQAASAGAQDVLKLLPKDAQGVVVVDFHKAVTTSLVDKAIKEDKNYQKYQDFIKETGIDPQKDVSLLAMALGGGEGEGMKQDAAVVVNLKYDKELLLAKIKKDSADIKEEVYNGVTIYGGIKEESGKPSGGAFLDASTVVFGTDPMIKKVIDVYQKKADNIEKNEALAPVIAGARKDALVWSAFVIPAEAMAKAAQQNPMMAGLDGLKAVTMFFDYRDKTYLAEIKALGGEETKNKQLADMLTGLKAMGAGAAAKNPEVGDLLNRIEISSSADFIKISAGLPEDLLQKLSKSATQKVEGMIQPKGEPEQVPEGEKTEGETVED